LKVSQALVKKAEWVACSAFVPEAKKALPPAD
jgi:hypothetical protein